MGNQTIMNYHHPLHRMLCYLFKNTVPIQTGQLSRGQTDHKPIHTMLSVTTNMLLVDYTLHQSLIIRLVIYQCQISGIQENCSNNLRLPNNIDSIYLAV